MTDMKIFDLKAGSKTKQQLIVRKIIATLLLATVMLPFLNVGTSAQKTTVGVCQSMTGFVSNGKIRAVIGFPAPYNINKWSSESVSVNNRRIVVPMDFGNTIELAVYDVRGRKLRSGFRAIPETGLREVEIDEVSGLCIITLISGDGTKILRKLVFINH